ncbi:out at first protein [Musca domestica]|uniref:Out at first protein n=1 Tax=Musca domestica TaxID=7370 RepID=A0A1I8N7Z1_MUSDO|nr:out at first protein [Musca domestica]
MCNDKMPLITPQCSYDAADSLQRQTSSTVAAATITTTTKTTASQIISTNNRQQQQYPFSLRPCCRTYHLHCQQPPTKQHHSINSNNNTNSYDNVHTITSTTTANKNNNSVASKCCWRHGFSSPLLSLFAAPPTLSPPLLFAGNKVRQRSSANDFGVVGGGSGGSTTFGLRLASVHKLHFVLFLLFNLLLRTCCGQLLINVQNQGGEVIQESITSNVSEDLITLEFQKSDGTLITQVIDFRNEVRILKALVLGEEERGQNLYQVMCFVTKFNKGDFISSDAMAKLRQKNPSTIRTPEEDKGKDTFTMTSWVHLNRSQPISRHLLTMCGEAIDATYVRDVDLKAWSELPGSSISSLEAATERFPDTMSSRCNEVSSLWAPCICTLETCIGWYPCGLKYCKGKNGGDNSAASSNYRCGIKTCRKCSLFSYYVRQKQQCLWDE